MEILKNNECDELINRYISGEMDENEKSEFLASLNKDEELRQRAELIGLIAKKIQEVNSDAVVTAAIQQTDEDDFRAKVLSIRQKRHSHNNRAAQCSSEACAFDMDGEEIADYGDVAEIAPKPESNSKSWWYSIAAGIIVIIGCFTVYQQLQSPDLMAIANEQNMQMISYSRGAEDSIMVAELNNTFEAIKTGKDVRPTIPKLTDLLLNANDNPTVENHKAEILWNLAIAYLKVDDKDNAIKTLKEVVAVAEGTPFAKNAQTLINKIE